MFRSKKALASICASAALVAGVAAPSAAAQQQQQDGLVNVAIGDITVRDVNIGIAALVAATVCDVRVGPVAVLARTVDRSGDSRTVCRTETGDVVLVQN